MTAKDRDEARREREDEASRLRVCKCDYPTKKQRNDSGHRPSCPAHRLWKKQHG